MLVKIYPENPNAREINKVVDVLKGGGIIVYPTDTVYGLGCDISNQKAAERLAQIKGVNLEKADFSFICHDLSNLSFYTRQINNNTFKLMKKNLPGPYTFILQSNNNVPKYFRSKKRTVGIRIPGNSIILELVKSLGNPIITTSVHDDDDIIEYTTDPELIYEKYKNQVDLVIDGGFGKNMPSTVVDCTEDVPTVIREGVGKLIL